MDQGRAVSLITCVKTAQTWTTKKT